MFLYAYFYFYEITIFSILLLFLLICIIAYTYLNTLWYVYCKTFILLSLLLFMMWRVPPGIFLLHLQKFLSFYFHPVCTVLILN